MILAADGRQVRKVGWIQATRGGVYFGFASKFHERRHYAYHADGSFYLVGDTVTRKLGVRLPLDSIKGLETMVFAAEDSETLKYDFYLPFDLKHADDSVYIDTRSLGSTWMFSVALLEPHALGSLEPLFAQGMTSIHIVARGNPWLVVSYRGTRHTKLTTAPGPQIHFRLRINPDLSIVCLDCGAAATTRAQKTDFIGGVVKWSDGTTS